MKTVILLVLCAVSIILSLLVYYKDDNEDDKDDDNNNENKDDNKNDNKNIKLKGNSLINQLINILTSYFQVNLNNINYTLNPYIDPIHINTDMSPLGIQAFKMTSDVNNITITISNSSPIVFNRYYTGGLMFNTNINCTLNLGVVNFTGINVMGHSLNNISFQNVIIPFSVNAKLLFNNNDYIKTKVSLTLNNTSTIYFPDTMKEYFQSYWSRVYLDYNTDEVMIAVVTTIKKQFWEQLNSVANLLGQINNHIPSIEDMINCQLTSTNSNNNCINTLPTQFINICLQNTSLINIVSQFNENPWDFTKILCELCPNNIVINYILVTIDPSDTFPNTNFPSNQVYLSTKDYSTCYAINMEKSNIDFIVSKYVEYWGFTSGQIINLNKGDRPVVLLKSNSPDGTIIIYPKVDGIWYSGVYNPKQNILSFNYNNNTVSLLLRGITTSSSSGTLDIYNSSINFTFDQDPMNNPIQGSFTYVYNNDDTITINGIATLSDGTTQNGLGTFHR